MAPKGAFLMEKIMSWFKRTPKVKEHVKLKPHHSSPFAEKILEETSKKVKKLPTEEQSKPK